MKLKIYICGIIMSVMVVFIHVLIALISLVWVALTYVAPTKLKLNVSYTLITLITLSGTYLIFETKTNRVQKVLEEK